MLDAYGLHTTYFLYIMNILRFSKYFLLQNSNYVVSQYIAIPLNLTAQILVCYKLHFIRAIILIMAQMFFLTIMALYNFEQNKSKIELFVAQYSANQQKL
jgi:hypothetical protein